MTNDDDVKPRRLNVGQAKPLDGLDKARTSLGKVKDDGPDDDDEPR